MITFGPARALKGVSAPGNHKSGQKQGRKSNAVDSEDRHVARHTDGVGNGGKRRVSLGFDAEIVVTLRYARDDNGIGPFSLAPRTIAVVTVVVTHFATKVPGLSGVLIDERIVQVDPMVIHGRGSFQFDGGDSTAKFEDVGDESSLAFRVSAIVLIGFLEDRLFFGAHVKPGHEHQEKNREGRERSPDSGDVDGDRRRLICEHPHGLGRASRQLETFPDFPAVHVLANGPGDFLVELLAREDTRRMNIVRDGGVFVDANLPGKFAENKIGAGIARLEVLVALAQIISSAALVHGELLANTNVVPVSVVFAKVANAFVRIEEHVFVPVVGDSVYLGAAPLEPDDFVVRASQLAARAERDQRLDVARDGFELLKNRQVGIFGVENGMAARAHDGLCLAEGTQHNGGAALRAIQRLSLRLGRPGQRWSARAHYQPSKLRRFLNLRSSNSTNSPRYRAGSGSL